MSSAPRLVYVVLLVRPHPRSEGPPSYRFLSSCSFVSSRAGFGLASFSDDSVLKSCFFFGGTFSLCQRIGAPSRVFCPMPLAAVTLCVMLVGTALGRTFIAPAIVPPGLTKGVGRGFFVIFFRLRTLSTQSGSPPLRFFPFFVLLLVSNFSLASCSPSVPFSPVPAFGESFCFFFAPCSGQSFGFSSTDRLRS